MLNWILFLAVLFGNFWIYRIFQQNILTFLILIFTTLLLYISLVQKNDSTQFRIRSIPLYHYNFLKKFLVVGFLILGLMQYQTTEIKSLTELTNDEQRIQTIRKGLYNSEIHIVRLFFYKLNLVNFFEGDFNTLSFRIQKNFFETVDPNTYFFAGHPRERIEGYDFSKFPFYTIFPWIIGIYLFIRLKRIDFFIYILTSIVFLSIIGHKNSLGPFLLFPFFILTIFLGINLIFKKFINK